jgi:predicted PurR-regulated permease PerM
MNEAGSARVLYRGALFAVALVILTVLAVTLRWVLIQLFVAMIIAAGMAPLVRLATDPEHARPWRWRPPRALVVLGIYLVLTLILVILGSVLLTAVVRSANALAAQLPDFQAEIQSWLDSLTQAFPWLGGVDLPGSLGGGAGLTQWASNVLGQVVNAVGVLFSIFGGFVNVLFIMFMALYLTVDAEGIRDYLLVFLPASRQEVGRRIVTNISFRLGHWVVGQLVLCAIVGGGAAIGLGLIGVPGAAILGIIWALAEFVPGIGPFISAVPSILLGFLAGPTVGVLAAIFTLAWSQIESNIITPRVMGRAVEINPLVVLLSLLVGNELLGLAGALISIPAAAAIAVVVDELHDVRKRHLQETSENAALEKVLLPG